MNNTCRAEQSTLGTLPALQHLNCTDSSEAQSANRCCMTGGQKVKVVLAAAMWNCPHLLVLDEPTNYLDRDSLGALADSIKLFEGGVVMISHNAGAHFEPHPQASWRH